MRLIITEKPSVARDIARVISGGKAQAEKIGGYMYYRYGDLIIAYAAGHIIRLAEPHELNSAWGGRWSLSALPMLPREFKLKPIADKKSILTALAKLMTLPEVKSLICATDAGREGELIFRYIYHYVGCNKPFQRLWISSMTDESIRMGFKNLLPGSEKDNLYRSALARAKMDWYIGYNFSRLYSVCYNTQYSVGRVQTAAVNMIVERDREIENFSKTVFYKLYLQNGAEWFDLNENTFITRSAAEIVKAECEGKTTTVISAETKRRTENRPLLYSLTSLQIEANERFGYSASLTLDTAQKLYEKKLLTYPRTDSNYITSDMPPSVTETLRRLNFYDERRVNDLLNAGLNFDRRVVDDTKVQDHHAIIPTSDMRNMLNTELSEYEHKILALVIERLFTALDKPYVYDETIYIFECAENTFSLVTKTPVLLGWRRYCLTPPEVPAVSYIKGETFNAENLYIRECETVPPKHFTESRLLSAMENIDRRIEDREKREFVKRCGLGTPATRAAVIERILKQGYIERNKQYLISTVKGRQMIDSVSDEIKSAELTADMERQLDEIERGKSGEEIIISASEAIVNNAIKREQSVQHDNRGDKPKRESVGKCPRCGGEVYESDKNFYCGNFSKRTCFFSVFKDDYFFTARGKTVTKPLIKVLLKNGKAVVSGFRDAESGREYDAVITLKNRKDASGKDKTGFAFV